MEREYKILSHLQENEITTQRKISKLTGLSLGVVNLLLKEMVRKGLVEVEKLNARTVRYILTPKGIKGKTRLTYHFVRSSYRKIKNITNAVEEHLLQIRAEGIIKEVVLYGPSDEIEAILINTLQALAINHQVIRPEAGNFKPLPGQHVLTWRSEEEEQLPGDKRVLNILNLI